MLNTNKSVLYNHDIGKANSTHSLLSNTHYLKSVELHLGTIVIILTDSQIFEVDRTKSRITLYSATG